MGSDPWSFVQGVRDKNVEWKEVWWKKIYKKENNTHTYVYTHTHTLSIIKNRVWSSRRRFVCTSPRREAALLTEHKTSKRFFSDPSAGEAQGRGFQIFAWKYTVEKKKKKRKKMSKSGEETSTPFIKLNDYTKRKRLLTFAAARQRRNSSNKSESFSFSFFLSFFCLHLRLYDYT